MRAGRPDGFHIVGRQGGGLLSEQLRPYSAPLSCSL